MSEDNLEVVSQEMMEELDEFSEYSFYFAMKLFIDNKFPSLDYYRCTHGIGNDYNVFLKVIKHVNGEPQFEAEKTKKWIVRSMKEVNLLDTWYLKNDGGIFRLKCCEEYLAIKFDTKEEAEKWTNPQTEVVEVEA